MNKPAQHTLRVRKRPAESRGRADHGWLQARFSFSFAEYFDPDHMGFHALRVMNNDRIQPGGGFPLHPHDNMEIFTYVIRGQLAHRDSMGNEAVIEAGEMQYMSAGRGVRHSEFNPSSEEESELYQIWLTPRERGGEPRYAEKPLDALLSPNELTLLFSPDGRGASTAIRQDAELSFARFDADAAIEVPAAAQFPAAWLQVIRGKVRVAAETLQTGDGLAIEGAGQGFTVFAESGSELFLFRLT